MFRCPLEFMGKINQKNLSKIIAYHDLRWCKPVHNDNELFAMMCLEILQAGLSWQTILIKENYIRKAFKNFKIQHVAAFNENYFNFLMKNENIIRNKLKINAIIHNAERFLSIRKEFGTFDNFIWNFVNFKPIDNKPTKFSDICTKNDLSEKISTDLKRRKFKFVGPIIIYSYMQAIGMVNDHHVLCSYR